MIYKLDIQFIKLKNYFNLNLILFKYKKLLIIIFYINKLINNLN